MNSSSNTDSSLSKTHNTDTGNSSVNNAASTHAVNSSAHDATTTKIAVPIFMLAAIVAMTPFSIDAYLPALPTIANEYQTSIHDIELSLSFFLVGFAFGQLFGGPISDTIGRKKAIYLGLSLFCVGTIAVLLSNSAHWLWVARVIQALGGGFSGVNPPAIIRDLSNGREAAKNLGKVAIIMMIAPLIAPIIGSSILAITHWHGIFIFLLIYAAVLVVLVTKRLPETRAHVTHKTPALKRYWLVVSNRYAMGYVFAQCCSYAGLFGYVTASSFIFIEYFGVSEHIFPYFFGANVITLAIFNRINITLLGHFNPHQLLNVGQAALLSTSLTLFLYVYFSEQPTLWVFAALLCAFCASLGMISSNASASAVESFPQHAATATAFIGASSYLWGAGAGFLTSYFADGTLKPVTTVFLGAALTGIILRAVLQLKTGSGPTIA